MPVIFFDLDCTLGSARLDYPSYRLTGFDVYPHVGKILEHLRDNGVRLGIISNTGDESAERINGVLEDAHIFGFFETGLLVYSSVVHYKKDSPEIFKLAVVKAGLSATPHQCMFVGEDRRERGYALEAGLLVAPHPTLAWDVLNGDPLNYVRVTMLKEQAR